MRKKPLNRPQAKCLYCGVLGAARKPCRNTQCSSYKPTQRMIVNNAEFGEPRFICEHTGNHLTFRALVHRKGYCVCPNCNEVIPI